VAARALMPSGKSARKARSASTVLFAGNRDQAAVSSSSSRRRANQETFAAPNSARKARSLRGSAATLIARQCSSATALSTPSSDRLLSGCVGLSSACSRLASTSAGLKQNRSCSADWSHGLWRLFVTLKTLLRTSIITSLMEIFGVLMCASSPSVNGLCNPVPSNATVSGDVAYA
jgi:hypothetical protein